MSGEEKVAGALLIPVVIWMLYMIVKALG